MNRNKFAKTASMMRRGGVRHVSTYLIATVLVTIGAMGVAGAPAASAAESCDINNHCYAFAFGPGQGNQGNYGQIYINCLFMPDNGNFVTSEIWDVDPTFRYWTEVGLATGPINGTYEVRHWYWADSRPNGGGYNIHNVGGSAQTATYYTAEVQWIGNNEWAVWGGNSFTQLGTSTNQPLSTSGNSEAGTEYTVAPGNGMRDIGQVVNFEFANNSGWHFMGNLATGTPAGSGAYITPSYDAASSDLTWTGPC